MRLALWMPVALIWTTETMSSSKNFPLYQAQVFHRRTLYRDADSKLSTSVSILLLWSRSVMLRSVLHSPCLNGRRLHQQQIRGLRRRRKQYSENIRRHRHWSQDRPVLSLPRGSDLHSSLSHTTSNHFEDRIVDDYQWGSTQVAALDLLVGLA